MVFLLSFINIVIAQKEQLRFEQISLEQGLSQTTVNCYLMDRNGFMWIGTYGGLNRYGFQSSILKTNNGGQHWAEIRFDKYLINDMYFADSLHGWIVGQDTSDHGMILETYDSGDNWAVQIEG
jgi:ligand-binding sensor domain-containing protein